MEEQEGLFGSPPSTEEDLRGEVLETRPASLARTTAQMDLKNEWAGSIVSSGHCEVSTLPPVVYDCADTPVLPLSRGVSGLSTEEVLFRSGNQAEFLNETAANEGVSEGNMELLLQGEKSAREGMEVESGLCPEYAARLESLMDLSDVADTLPGEDSVSNWLVDFPVMGGEWFGKQAGLGEAVDENCSGAGRVGSVLGDEMNDSMTGGEAESTFGLQSDNMMAEASGEVDVPKTAAEEMVEVEVKDVVAQDWIAAAVATDLAASANELDDDFWSKLEESTLCIEDSIFNI